MKMTVGRKIWTMSAILVACTVLLAAASLFGLGRVSERMRILQVDSIPGQYSAGRIDAVNTQLLLVMNQAVLDVVAGTGTVRDAKAAVAAAEAKVQEELKAYEKT